MKVNKTYYGFNLKEKRYVKEIESTAYEFEHIKTGAKLLFMENDDKNKVFSITFKTPPVDSCGTAHIIEHSVLCGSKKYPLKEPFVELVKSSLNTFLNAMTFSDKTMYPVASLNEADFENLMDVYLDAVFNPLIYDKKHILEQEGWHYHIEDEKEDIIYNGVVYNEMKGAFSNPLDILYRNIESSLYPNTPYEFESGGDPSVIPTLTYEKFLEFHKMYYHPSNSYIYIYGDTDIKRHLKYIDKEYLSGYEKIDVEAVINEAEDFTKPIILNKEYSISEDEKEDDKYILSLNYSVGDTFDLELSLKMQILEKILFDTDSSILKKKLIEENIADEISFDYSPGILNPMLSIIAKNAKKDKAHLFKKTIIDTLKDIVREGICEETILPAINNLEFELKEGDSGSYPAGLLYNITVMESWLYDGKPTLLLEYDEALDNIKKNYNKGIFEQVIKNYILNNNHSSYITLIPKKNLTEKNEKKIKKKLKDYKDSLSKEELESIIKDSKELKKIQSTPDSDEDKKLIPTIKVSDIDKKPNVYDDVDLIEERNNRIFIRSDKTKGISYIDVNFEISLNEKEIFLFNLMAKCFEEFKTKNYSVIDLNNEINLKIGDIDYKLGVYENIDDSSDISVYFMVEGKALIKNEKDIYNLMEEIIKNTVFDDKAKLKDIVSRELSKMESKFISASHLLAFNKTRSAYSKKSMFIDLSEGIEFYTFLKALLENFDKCYEEIFATFKKMQEMIFLSRKDIIITTEKENYKNSINLAKEFFNKYNNDNKGKIEFEYEQRLYNLGLVIPSQVNYVAKGYNFKKLGYEYSGHLQVLKKYLSTEYLWNNIRVMGGAYGSFISIDKYGDFTLCSYRDPNVEKTLEVYNNIPEKIKSFNLDKENVNKLIIGTISDIDIPKSVYNKTREYVIRSYTNDTYDNILKRREEILSTTKKDIISSYDLVRDVIEVKNICVIGNSNQLSKDLFDEVTNCFK